jgi:hypothetical protein
MHEALGSNPTTTHTQSGLEFNCPKPKKGGVFQNLVLEAENPKHKRPHLAETHAAS